MTLTSRSAPSLTSKSVPTVLVVLLLAAGLAACQSSGDESTSENALPVVEITAVDYAFKGAPDSIRSGWTTFQLTNKGRETHVLEFLRLPEGVQASEYNEVIDLGDSLRRQLSTGAIDTAEARKTFESRTPAWWPPQEYMGGTGYVAPGRTSQVTNHMEPAAYVMLCFINTSDGQDHRPLGMRRTITVTEETTGASAPEPDLALDLSNYEISTSGTMRAGKQTVELRFGPRKQETEGPFQGIQLVRLEPGDDAREIGSWIEDHQNPAPAEFLGGSTSMPAGNTAYFTVDLDPGRYAWVSHATAEKGMLKTFTIE